MGHSDSGLNSRLRPLVLERQRLLLGLLDAVGGKATNLDFQKLLFLLCQDPSISGSYEFVPYKFGAFSFTSYADRRKLIDRGFLESSEHQWQLSDAGRKYVGDTADLLISACLKRIGRLRGDALVAETYRRYPYYAIRSEIAERVLGGDQVALRNIEVARPRRRSRRMSTIGYEGRSLEAYLNELIRSGVTILCDVRRNPISRKYGFAKSTLARGCDGVGIRYEHLPELGISSDRRRSLETREDHESLFAEYERKDLPLQIGSLAKIQSWIQSGEHVALTCYERVAHDCHRHCVAEAIEQRLGNAFVATHL